jgi:hypothetical protein
MKNPVLLIQAKNPDMLKAMAHRNEVMEILREHEGIENFDASGSRAVIWFENGNTEKRLKAIVKKLGDYPGAVLSVIEDPGLGIVLPGDF